MDQIEGTTLYKLRKKKPISPSSTSAIDLQWWNHWNQSDVAIAAVVRVGRGRGVVKFWSWSQAAGRRWSAVKKKKKAIFSKK